RCRTWRLADHPRPLRCDGPVARWRGRASRPAAPSPGRRRGRSECAHRAPETPARSPPERRSAASSAYSFQYARRAPLPLPDIEGPLPYGRGSDWVGKTAPLRSRLGLGAEYQRARDIHLAPLHGVAAGVVVILPLILVVAGTDLAGLSDGDI